MLSCSVLVQPQDKHWGALDNWEWAVKGISSSTVWDCSPSDHLFFSLCPTAWNHWVYWFMPTKLTPGLEKTAFLGIVPCPSLGESVKHSLKPLWLTSPELNCTKKVFNFFLIAHHILLTVSPFGISVLSREKLFLVAFYQTTINSWDTICFEILYCSIW